MANINWWETASASDCISPGYTNWNDMVDYIEHSACTDFTIYSTCTSTGQAFRFTQTGTTSLQYGGTNASDVLQIQANDADTYPYVHLAGGANASIYHGTGQAFKLYETTNNYMFMYEDTDSIIATVSDRNLTLAPNGTGIVQINSNAVNVGGSDRGIYINDDETYIGHGAGDSITDGTNNTLVGHDAGTSITDGDYNTLIGRNTGDSIIGGHGNVGMGYAVLPSVTTGNYNAAFGHQAGNNTAVGINNCVLLGAYAGENNTAANTTAVGFEALENNTGIYNTAVGYLALTANLGGTNNVALGYTAGDAITTGNYNTIVGSQAGGLMTTQGSNSALGYYAMGEYTGSDSVAIGNGSMYQGTGIKNTGVGINTFRFLTTGYNNTAMGYYALRNLTEGFGNSAFGYSALESITLGERNVGIGRTAGYTITTGDYNVIMGYSAGEDCAVDLQNSVMIGYSAGYANTANSLIAIGYGAGQNNTGAVCTGVGYNSLTANTGDFNSALGYEALVANTSGWANAAIGCYALQANTVGYRNTALGSGAGQTAAVGADDCVYVGTDAGKANTQDGVVFIGYQAGDANTGGGNIGIGRGALGDAALSGAYNICIGEYSGLDMTTGTSNVGVGREAFRLVTEGNYNTALGLGALAAITTGDNNTAVGMYAGQNTGVDVNGAIYLGYYAGQNNTTANTLHINNSNSAFPLIWGDFANDIVKFGNNSDDFFLEFSTSGDDSFIKGGGTSGDDLFIYSNTIDAKPFMYMNGNGTFGIISGDNINFECGDGDYIALGDEVDGEFIHFYDDTDAVVEGNSRNLRLTAESTYIKFYHTASNSFQMWAGGGESILESPTNGTFRLAAPNTIRMAINSVIVGDILGDASDFRLKGYGANANVWLETQGTGVVRFGTYSAKGAEAFAGYITIKDAGGTTRKLMVCA